MPAISTTSPSRASSIARAIAARAVGLDLDVADGAGDDLVDDRLRILAARVVGGDDRDVGELGREPPHQRPLAAVAVAAGADDADHAAARCELARGAQDVLERARLVGVVDDHRERLPLVDRLEAPGHAAHRLEPARDRVVVDAEQPRSGERAERVLDVEAAAQLDVDPVERLRAELRVVREAERERVRQLRREPPSVLVADVDRGAAATRSRKSRRFAWKYDSMSPWKSR